MSSNRGKLKKGQKIYLIIIVLFIVTVLSVQMGRLYKKNQSAQNEKARLLKEKKRLLKENRELIKYEKYTKEDDFFAISAEKNLSMVKGNWIIFKEKH